MHMHHYMIKLTSRRFFIMDTTDYWLFAHKYSIWNAAVTAQQFWTNDLNPQALSSATERVYTAFFYSDSAQHLQYIEEILCNLKFFKNRTKFFSRETSFCQFSNMASSGLKKMLILIILYTHKSVSVNMWFTHIYWDLTSSPGQYTFSDLHIFTDTLSCVYKIFKINIFLRSEEAMLENWWKLVSLLKNFVLFLRNFKLHDVKQNEKYLFALKKYYLVPSWPHWTMPSNGNLPQKILHTKVGAKV